ncbi:hypothetical protein Acy02nite_00020 [Actinoplanes cyaneus]|uniref:DUF3990 domain-containing protein n=1 Tax=Actinoplanes cyaneus TaxID=52696 RepID=A0A919M8L9_9ACTN|nr:DUF3990 domain-containing protein [Actinoplanes cyaneus]MCW2142576.1 Protein of unknown function (DUF3990) [Actinoplanes cyaneus]GID62121.1 hypothetical protein Acy02nite_00020 [Actinoplanes cyaneus]
MLAGTKPVLVHNCGDDDDVITLYHGTTKGGAENIRKNGIDPTYADPDKDFGQGFYTTTSRSQAESWARGRYGKNGEVMQFQVKLSDLVGTKGKVFPNSGGPEYEKFVRGQRTGSDPMHGYDWVEGPMVTNVGPFKKGAKAKLWGQQWSFHSKAAAAALKLVS